MIAQTLFQACFLFAAAYAGLWAIRGAVALCAWLERSSLARSSARRLRLPVEGRAAPSAPGHAPYVLTIWALAGAALAWVSKESLDPFLSLAVLLFAGLAMEELSAPHSLAWLPEVITLLQGLHDQGKARRDVFAALQAAALRLPVGPVREAVEEACVSSAAESLDSSLSALKGINPYLDELAVDIRQSGWEGDQGWETNSSLEATLAGLLARAEQEWAVSSRRRLLLDRLSPLVPLARSVLLGVMAVILVGQAPAMLAEIRFSYLAVGVLLVGLLALALRFTLTRPWLRRSLATAALAVGVLLLLSAPSSPPVQAVSPTPTNTPLAPIFSPTPSATATFPAPPPTLTPPPLPVNTSAPAPTGRPADPASPPPPTPAERPPTATPPSLPTPTEQLPTTTPPLLPTPSEQSPTATAPPLPIGPPSPTAPPNPDGANLIR